MCITSWRFNNCKQLTLSPEFIFSRILYPLKERGVQRLSLSGGEPTISPNLLRVLEQARGLGYKILLATNALSEKVHSFESILREMETGFSAIQVSFDSLREREFNQIRGGDFYASVVRNIKKLGHLLEIYRSSTRLVVSVVVQEENSESFLDTVDFSLSTLRADRVTVQLRHDYQEVTTSNWTHQSPPSLTAKARKSILEKGKSLFDMSKKENRIGIMGKNIGNWEALLENPTHIRQKCGSGKIIFVDAYGNLRGCIYAPVIMNLSEIAIEDYLASKPFQDFLAFAEKCNICIHGCSNNLTEKIING